MGGCVGTTRHGGRGSRRPSAYSESTSSALHTTHTKNKPLRRDKIRCVFFRVTFTQMSNNFDAIFASTSMCGGDLMERVMNKYVPPTPQKKCITSLWKFSGTYQINAFYWNSIYTQ